MKLRNARGISFREYLASDTGMEMLMWSHLQMNVRFGRAGPAREFFDYDGEVAEIRFLVGGAAGWSLPTAVAPVTGEGVGWYH